MTGVVRAVRPRDWRAADLRHLQAVVAARWAVHGTGAGWHVGDMAWWVSQWEWPTPDGPSGHRRLWFDDTTGEPVAWAWATPPREFDFAVRPDRDDDGVHELLLEWGAGVLDGIETSALENDAASVRALRGAGLNRGGTHFECLVARLADLPADPPRVPPGYTLRPVTGPDDVAARVAVHRAVWHPSQVTETSYRQVMAAWPYRPGLDWVAVAPDGSFAAFALAWLDAANAAVVLEPVGTHEQHRRLGLGRAVCLAALQAARGSGASAGVVNAEPGGAAQALYEAVGFRRLTTRHSWRTGPADLA